MPKVYSHVSSFPVGPSMSSVLANNADLTGTRAVHCQNPDVPPYLLATGLKVPLFKVVIILPFLALQIFHSALYLLRSPPAESFLL